MDDQIQEFMSVSGATAGEAAHYLAASEGDLPTALEAFFANAGARGGAGGRRAWA